MARQCKPARERMRRYRADHLKTIAQMAALCGCSTGLLRAIEVDGWITHPNIAARIAAAYKLDVNAYNELIPKEHRVDTLPAPRSKPTMQDYTMQYVHAPQPDKFDRRREERE